MNRRSDQMKQIEQTQVGIGLNPLNAIACRKWKWVDTFSFVPQLFHVFCQIFMQSAGSCVYTQQIAHFDWERRYFKASNSVKLN